MRRSSRGRRIQVAILASTVAAIVGVPASGASLSVREPVTEGSRGQGAPKLYAFVYAGSLDSNETTAILDHESNAGAVGVGWGWRFQRFMTFELDANFMSAEYALPVGIGRPDLGDDKLEVSTTGMYGNVKFAPSLGRLHPYVGVGLGVGVVDVSISNEEYYFPVPLEAEFSLLTQLVVGADVRLTRRSYLGLEYREVFAYTEVPFAGEEVDGGGRSVSLVYRLGVR